MDGDYVLIISNVNGNGISHVVLKNFKFSICWVTMLLLSKNKTTLAFDIESEKKLQQKFNSKMYLKGYLLTEKTSSINLIKFILQNSDMLKKYLDKDDFKEINKKKYYNVYEVHKRKSEFLYDIKKGEDEILKTK